MKNDRMKWIWVAASVLVLALAWVFLRKPAESLPVDQLMAQYYVGDTEAAKAVALGRESQGFAADSTRTDTLLVASRLLENLKYQECLPLVNGYLAANPENDTAKYFQGQCYFLDAKYGPAGTVFTPLSQKEGFAFRENAQWYLGLCLFKAVDGKPEALALFEQICKDQSSKRRKDACGIADWIRQDIEHGK